MSATSLARALIPSAFLVTASFLVTPAAATQKPDVRARLVAPERLVAGAKATKATVAVELTFGPGWHANSHTPSEEFLVPTDLDLTATGGTLSPVRYPKEVERKLSFSEKPLRVYDGTVRFEADLTVPASAPGKVAIKGSLSYQACNDTQCFAPTSLPLAATVTVVAAGRSK